MVATLAQDLRYALRSFLRAPRFTLPALAALALGIGATSAIFSVVRGVMLEPLPYDAPERVVSIWESNASRGRTRNVVAAANFIAWKERARSFEYLGMVGPARFTLLIGGEPHEIDGQFASSEVFSALGVQPLLGRTYTAEEDLRGNDAVIVSSYEFWQTRLGGRHDIVGSAIVANGVPRTIVGVMPPGFTIEGQKASFWAPYGWTTELLRAAPGRGSSHGIARLRDGITVAQAQDEMRRLMAQLEREAPARNTGWSAEVVPVHEAMIEAVRPALLLLSGAVLLVLLIACVNVANLLLARSTVRERELGVRTALGASHGRLFAQLLTESVLLSLIGGAAGLALAAAFHRGLVALVANRIPVPRLDQVQLDGVVVLFTFAAALATGVLFGLAPALMAARGAAEALRDGGRHGTGRRARRVLGALVAAEVAIALVLLAGAGLLVRSFVRLQSVDPGFRAQGVLTARVSLPAVRYSEPKAIVAFFESALDRIRQLPGVENAAGISFPPLAGPGIGTSFYRLDRPEPPDGQKPVTEVRPVTPGFFATMSIPLLAGRDITPADTVDAPAVAVVSQSLVRRHLAGEDPIGRRLHVNIGGRGGMQVEIVGVVGDVKFSSLDAETPPAVYLPMPQLALAQMTLLVRTPIDPLSLAPSVAAAVREIDPALPLGDVRTMDDIVNATLARPRAISVLLVAFAGIALLLAGVGVYGVMAYSVSQRTQEIGVRMALGATMASVQRLVLGQAMRLVLVGLGIGLAAAAALAQLLRGQLFEIEPLDPLTFTVTAGVLTGVAALASYVPARRGTRIAPVDALRVD
jgi:putative ABC transport system permease protein